MEIADIFVINKADHPGWRKWSAEIQSLSAWHRPDGWTPPIIRTVATDGRHRRVMAAIEVARTHTRKCEPAPAVLQIDHLGSR